MSGVEPFVPAIASGVGALFGMKSSSGSSSLQNSPLATAATAAANNQTDLAKYLKTQSQSTYGLSAPAYGKAISYYSTLLGGNQAAMTQAVAPETAQLRDVYAGANSNLERLGVRGGEAMTAKAELNRQQAGQVGQLVTGARAGAAQQLGQLGQGGMYAALAGGQAAVGAGNSAGSIFSDILKQSTSQGNTEYNRSSQIGSSFMTTLLPALIKLFGGGGGGNGNGTSNTGTGDSTPQVFGDSYGPQLPASGGQGGGDNNPDWETTGIG